MNNNAWFKKENPFQTVIGFGGGATGFGAYSSASKTYVDDVFKPYVWTGTGSSRDISNGIDLSGKGGMAWIKKRDGASIDQNNVLFDTERDIGGVPAYVIANTDESQDASATLFSAFNSDGFTVGSSDITNGSYSTPTYGSWSFRKQKGFFDIVTYTGSSSARTISHNLGCVPGAIFIKKTSGSDYWAVYHEGLDSSSPEDYYLKLNETSARIDDANFWNDTKPTDSVFSLGDAGAVNSDGHTYVAYLFAGGDPEGYGSTQFVNNSTGKNYLKTGANTGFAFGTGTFTVECWFKVLGSTGTYNTLLATREDQYNNSGAGWSLVLDGNNIAIFSNGWDVGATDISAADGNWHHVAFVREGTGSNQAKLYHNGTSIATFTLSNNFTNDVLGIANTPIAQYEPLWGRMSNVRVTKGQAIYTSNFTPSTSPLTTTSQSATAANVVLLCCNTNKGGRFTKSNEGLIAAGGSTTGNTDSPFTAPASNNLSQIFGDDEDQDIVATGSYIGNGEAIGPNIDLGWEPQYLLIKNTDLSAENWHILDNIRGIIATDTGDGVLSANTNGLELTQNIASLTSTGFTPKTSDDKTNGDGHTYIYMAIRRPDGYVGKPASAGTDVFAMDTGNASPDIPTFDSGFPVDFAIMRNPASEDPNFIGWRLTGKEGSRTNTAEASSDFGAQWAWGSNAGWCANSNYSTGTNSWMWKRNSGFDVLEYTGDGVAGRGIQHSLNAVPEMFWIRKRNGTTDWVVYHSGMSSTSHYMKLNNSNPEANGGTAMLNSTAPTSTAITLGSNTDVNANTDSYMAMLFSSVTGISKVGSYTGNGSATERTITTGFQPRFLIVKNLSGYNSWFVFDTLRGWASGNDSTIVLDDDAPEQSSDDIGAPAANGFTLTSSLSNFNENGITYLYYAHA